VAEQANVQPSEEPVFVLTGSQLQDIIARAVQPLQDEVQILKDTIALQGEKMAALEATQDLHADNQLIQLKLINDLRKGQEPQPLQKDRGEILRALLAANDGKMLLCDARQKMRMSKQSFTNLLTVLPDIGSKSLYTDKRKRILYLK
jgi:hypothetical protein